MEKIVWRDNIRSIKKIRCSRIGLEPDSQWTKTCQSGNCFVDLYNKLTIKMKN